MSNRVKIIVDVDDNGSVRVLKDTKGGVEKLGKSVDTADKRMGGMNRTSKNLVSTMKQVAIAFGAYKALEAGVRLMRESIRCSRRV